jgi:hypothetical protein
VGAQSLIGIHHLKFNNPETTMAYETEIGQNPPPPSSALKVAIIEDHREFRDYLVALVGGTEGFRCAGSFRSMGRLSKRSGPICQTWRW